MSTAQQWQATANEQVICAQIEVDDGVPNIDCALLESVLCIGPGDIDHVIQ
jgi:hypothetical protein